MLKPFQDQLENCQFDWPLAYSVADNRKSSKQHSYTFETGPTKNTKGLFDIEILEHKQSYSKKAGAGKTGHNTIYKDDIGGQ